MRSIEKKGNCLEQKEKILEDVQAESNFIHVVDNVDELYKRLLQEFRRTNSSIKV
jgi:hypothetical protein